MKKLIIIGFCIFLLACTCNEPCEKKLEQKEQPQIEKQETECRQGIYGTHNSFPCLNLFCTKITHYM